MNEKLKELLAKHIAPPALAVTRDLENQHTAHVTYTVSQAEMETLLSAEVEECLSVVYDPDGTDYGSAHDIVYADIDSRLKQHFGVEE